MEGLRPLWKAFALYGRASPFMEGLSPDLSTNKDFIYDLVWSSTSHPLGLSSTLVQWPQPILLKDESKNLSRKPPFPARDNAFL